MKIGNTIKWMFLLAVCNLNAQNKYSFDFGVNTKPSEDIKMSELSLGIDYSKTFRSEFVVANELEFHSKSINYFNSSFSNLESSYNQLSNKVFFSYLKSKKTQFNFEIEPFIASENNLKWNNIDVLGALNIDFNWNEKNSMKLGLSRNTVFGKPMILPIFTYNYQYNSEINFSLGFTETNIKYTNNPRNTFYIKNIFNGSFYNLENHLESFYTNSTKASFSQQTTSFEYERNMDKNWYINFKAGYDFNRKYLLLDTDYKTISDFNIKDGCNLGITIKYKH